MLTIVGGIVAIPGVTHWFQNFLEPTFADSKYLNSEPSTSAAWIGLVVGAGIALAGIAIAYVCYIRQPGLTTVALLERMPFLHRLLVNRWYFDELYDALFVRPGGDLRALRPLRRGERVRAGHARGRRHAARDARGTNFARTVQSGYLRALCRW